ncbi:hypothetical protein AGABI2DRAFT_196124 [Agaricus bisporus var. bisporus H97]|uniref:hypothetical protein n=1 Tax=Agaricus bisporus var. bisporus (strain H97 / ATCC MYA-4626 / FGSC 10389) TaxID=936046 RepID=UPI00029F5958|nr:hypothetical protein AGABI2DRAFT_196124 [Agaricus bisporus var. bisporus H97]EKV41796.1 hypothetical protein AGABI2DRAFT_196124 [Agaricus bisporus var. bisporus H97]
MSATLDDNVPLDNTFGAMLIGVVVSAVLHGVCLLQAFYYFQRYKKDPFFMKALVVILCTFDAFHLCMVTHTVYHYNITGFNDDSALKRIVFSVVIEALPTGLNGAFVQTFYTYRVWRLSNRNYFLTGLILVLIFCCAGCGTAWVVIVMQLKTYERLLDFNPLTITINALSTSIDVLIALSLVFLLHSARTGFKRSDTMINKLIIFVVNTGILTTLCAISSLISLVASPRTLLYASFYFCIGRLYSNSFLATLNARNGITDSVDNVDHMMVSLPRSALSSTQGKSQQQNISIRIDTTQESLHDAAMRKAHTARMRSGMLDSVSDMKEAVDENGNRQY